MKKNTDECIGSSKEAQSYFHVSGDLFTITSQNFLVSLHQYGKCYRKNLDVASRGAVNLGLRDCSILMAQAAKDYLGFIRTYG
jgi:hypothetical protein